MKIKKKKMQSDKFGQSKMSLPSNLLCVWLTLKQLKTIKKSFKKKGL